MRAPSVWRQSQVHRATVRLLPRQSETRRETEKYIRSSVRRIKTSPEKGRDKWTLSLTHKEADHQLPTLGRTHPSTESRITGGFNFNFPKTDIFLA